MRKSKQSIKNLKNMCTGFRKEYATLFFAKKLASAKSAHIE